MGLGAVFVGSSILGLSAIFVKWAVAGGATPVAVGAYRLLFALPGTYLLARSESRNLPLRGQGNGWLWCLLAGVFFFCDFGALGLQAQQIATLFLGAWLLSEPLRPLGLLGGGLIMAGILAVAFGPSSR